LALNTRLGEAAHFIGHGRHPHRFERSFSAYGVRAFSFSAISLGFIKTQLAKPDFYWQEEWRQNSQAIKQVVSALYRL
jgi:hypothetical protein